MASFVTVTPFQKGKQPQWQLPILSPSTATRYSQIGYNICSALNSMIIDGPLTMSSTENPPLSQRTHAPTDQLDMPSLIFPPQAKLNVPSLNFPAKRSLSARSLFSLPASLSQLARRVRVLQAEVRVFLEAKAVVVDHQAVDVAEDVVVEDEAAVLLVV
jgi:hypothetical protein